MSDDPVAKARALEDRALNAKRVAFARLQVESPDVARFLTDVAAVFGRPAGVVIRFAEGDRYATGMFRKAQDFPDFERRADALRDAWIVARKNEQC